MKYTVEESLSQFRFWSGGKDRANMLTSEQLDQVEEHLEELLGEEYSDTDINDLFWFEFESVCSSIGLKYTEDDEVIDDEEDWARTIIDEYNHDLYEIYFDGFWSENEGAANSERQVRDLFDEYVSDNWLDHANEVLEENFPDVEQELRDEFACEHWQNCGTDDWNCEQFQEWALAQVNAEYDAERDEHEKMYGPDNEE